MSFETSAELSLTVDEGDLQNVRQQIEDEIGTTEVGVTDGGSMSAQSAGGGRRGRRSMRLAQDRTELLEDAVAYLEDIEDAVSEGGLGGDGGGGIFAELIGAGAETGGDLAIEAGDTVAEALTDVLTGAAASTFGNVVANSVSGSEVDVADTPLEVDRPEWVDEPLAVEDVGPIDVDDPGPIAVEDPGPIEVNVSATATTTTTTTPSSGGSGGGGSSGGVQLGGPNGIVVGNGGIQAGGDDGITIGRDPGDPTGAQSGGGPTVTTTVEPQIDVSVDGANLVDDVEREVENKFREVRDELRDELEDVRGQVEALERGIRGIR